MPANAGMCVYIAMLTTHTGILARLTDRRTFLANYKENNMAIITKSDFTIRKDNFNLCNGVNLIRIICGLFMIPHSLTKFADGGFLTVLNPGTIGFFESVGLAPGAFWVWIAFLAEFGTGIALILGICTRWAAFGAGCVLLVAVYALHAAKGFGWLWNKGGYEYPVFWAVTCFAIAIIAFREYKQNK